MRKVTLGMRSKGVMESLGGEEEWEKVDVGDRK